MVISIQSEPKSVFALSDALDERLHKAWAVVTCLVVQGHRRRAGDEALEGARDMLEAQRALIEHNSRGMDLETLERAKHTLRWIDAQIALY